MSKQQSVLTKSMSPGVAFTAIFGLIAFLFLSWWIGAFMLIGAVVWHVTHQGEAS